MSKDWAELKALLVELIRYLDTRSAGVAVEQHSIAQGGDHLTAYGPDAPVRVHPDRVECILDLEPRRFVGPAVLAARHHGAVLAHGVAALPARHRDAIELIRRILRRGIVPASAVVLDDHGAAEAADRHVL